MTRDKTLQIIQEAHQKGERPNLSGENLRQIDLRKKNISSSNLYMADLRQAKLDQTNLYQADLRRTNMYLVNLYQADLRDADLRGADMRGSDLDMADLQRSDLRNANLELSDLNGTNLYRANMKGANLFNTNLSKAKNIPLSAYRQTKVIPARGEVLGWKKCQNDVIVKLLIPSKARRCNATTRKCRAEYIEVIEVIGADIGVSRYDNKTTYRVGETVRCRDWDKNRWNECSGGIHFFLTREEAEEWARL